MPGSLIKASKISNIPDAFTIGPCRNIVIHVRINDVQVSGVTLTMFSIRRPPAEIFGAPTK